MLVRYHLEFEKTNKENHFFTVHSVDYVLESIVGKDSDSEWQIYYEEFNLAIQVKGIFEMGKPYQRIGSKNPPLL